MTRATSASRKAMRPVRKSEPQGTATTRTTKTKPVPVDLDALLQSTVEEFGAPADALTNVEAAHRAAVAADAAVIAWTTFVTAWKSQGRSGRAFGEAVKAITGKGNPNTFGKLEDTAALLLASKKGKGTRALTPLEAVAAANSRGRGAVAVLVAEMGEGKDPLHTKTTRPGAVKPNSTKTAAGKGSNATKRASATTVSEATIVGLLQSMVRIAPSVKDAAVAVEASKIASALAADLTKRAAVLSSKPVKGTPQDECLTPTGSPPGLRVRGRFPMLAPRAAPG